MQNSNQSNKGGIKTLVMLIVGAAAVFSALSASHGSLVLYMGAEYLGASGPASLGAAVTGWIVSFIFGTLVLSGILAVAAFMASIVYALVVGKKKDNTPATEEEKKGAAALKKIATWALIADVGLSALIALYGSFVQYAIFSAADANIVLNLLAAVLSFVLNLASFTVVLGFIGTIAAVILSVIYWLFSGGMKKGGNGGGN